MNNSSQSTFINPLDRNIEDSKINITNSSSQFKNDSTINPDERNIETKKSIALINVTNPE